MMLRAAGFALAISFAFTAAAQSATVTLGGVELGFHRTMALGVGSAVPGVMQETFSTLPYSITRRYGSGKRKYGRGTRSMVRLSPSGNASRYVATSTGVILNLPAQENARIDYAGFLWGSVDSWNAVSLLGPDDVPLTLTGGGVDYGTELDGLELAALAGLTPAALDNPLTVPTLYANFTADADEAIVAVRFITSRPAFEFDNLAWRFDPTTPGVDAGVALTSYETLTFNEGLLLIAPLQVPAPAMVALFGLGLAGIALRRTRS